MCNFIHESIVTRYIILHTSYSNYPFSLEIENGNIVAYESPQHLAFWGEYPEIISGSLLNHIEGHFLRKIKGKEVST